MMNALLMLVGLVGVLVPLGQADDSIKVYFDQDVMVGSSNVLSLAMLLRHATNPNHNRRIDVVGVGVVAGDSHIEDAVYHALQAAEFCGAADIPVARGADVPYFNSKSHVLGRMGMYGPKGGDNWLGEWAKGQTIKKLPNIDDPTLSPSPTHAALLLIELARKYEGELVVVTGGPLTNIALAVRLAPDIVGKIKAVYTMAGAVHVKSKFNFWWDAESASVFLRANWTKKVIVPIDVCETTKFTPQLLQQALPSTPSPYKKWLETQYFNTEGFAVFGLAMWDELLVAILFQDVYGRQPPSFYGKEPGGSEERSKGEEIRLLDAMSQELVKKETSLDVLGCGEVAVREVGGELVERGREEDLVIERQELFLDVDCVDGPQYGSTLWWENNEKMKEGLPGWLSNIPPWEVITKINTKVFENMFISVVSSDH